MPKKPVPVEIDALRQSLKRAKEIFATKQTDPFGWQSARAYGYLEMAVEQFLASKFTRPRRLGPRAGKANEIGRA